MKMKELPAPLPPSEFSTAYRILNGDRFSIRDRPGVYQVEVDEEFGLHTIQRYYNPDFKPVYESMGRIANCLLTCTYVLLGLPFAVEVPLMEIYFDSLTYDDLPF
jgi:hypothetical protein